MKPGSETYTYDGLNRLVRYQRGYVGSDGTLSGTASVDQSWGLDSQGNWTSVTDNLTSTETDNAFNLQNEETYVFPHYQWYDDNGNLKASGVNGDQYIYDAWNRQVEVKDQLGNPVVTYSYDALGRRVTSTPNGGTATNYYSSDDQVIEQTDHTGAAVYNYVWNPAYIDDMAWREDAGSGDVVYSIADINHNIVAITNSSGEVIERYQYDPYGNVTYYYADGTLKSTQASGYEWSYLFQGKRLDGPGAGQYDFRGRVYDPATGTFDQQDPDGYVNGPNLYQLEGGNPLLRVDPMGTVEGYAGNGQGGWNSTTVNSRPSRPKPSGGTKDVAIEVDPDAKGKGGGPNLPPNLPPALRDWILGRTPNAKQSPTAPTMCIVKCIPCRVCHGVSGNGFNGDPNSFSGLPGSGPDALLGYQILERGTAALAPIIILPIGGALGAGAEIGIVEGSGISVIGSYPAYVNLGEELGAGYFSIPTEQWNAMTEAERWATNQQFLDEALARGDTFRLATELKDVREGSYFQKELQYLMKRGCQLSSDGSALTPPGK